MGHMESLHHSQRREGWDIVQWATFRHCHSQVWKASITPPEPLATSPSFVEPLPRNSLLASVPVLQKG